MWLFRIVGSKLMSLVATALAAGASILLVFFSGKRSEQKKQKIKDLEAYKEAREAMDAVDTDLDRDARIERLRKHNNVRKD
jgi:predicted nicotinamide N-methyase